MLNLPIPLPSCPDHGPMTLRPHGRQTYEQKWCGTWYDCPQCHNHFLFPSSALTAQLAANMKGEA